MHKDQKRIQDALLPRLAARIVEESPEAERDCTVLNRLLTQGPDPLYIMETVLGPFAALCDRLGLTVEEGRDAIERAHWQGPGVLLKGTGLAYDHLTLASVNDIPVEVRQEILWLILASMSDCTEEGYTPGVTFAERIRRATHACIAFTLVVEAFESDAWDEPLKAAYHAMQDFVGSVTFTKDERGIPHTDKDHGFYVGYKKGYPVVGVLAGELTFYGTPPEHTLAGQGVTVDKAITPQFGIVFLKQ